MENVLKNKEQNVNIDENEKKVDIIREDNINDIELKNDNKKIEDDLSKIKITENNN